MCEAGHFVGSLEKGDTLFEHIGGGVHEAGIDVPELAQGEEVGGVLCVFEGKGRSFIDRDGAGVGVAIRSVATVEAESFVFHRGDD